MLSSPWRWPELRKRSAAEQRTDKILIQGNPAGTQTVRIEPGGAVRAEYSYNDRGRGDHIIATWKLDADGVPIEYEGRGNDYMKAAVEERFEMKGGKASWKNRSEKGDQAVAGKAFYLPMNAPPEFVGVLARALLKAPEPQTGAAARGRSEHRGGRKSKDRQRRIDRVPHHRAQLHPAIDLARSRRHRGVGLVLVFRCARGIGVRDPTTANGSGKDDAAWSERIARALAHQPRGDLVIRNARLFDPRDLSVTPGTSVLVRGDRIVRVGPDADIKPSAGAEIIDAHGRFLMPGLWDNHQHLADSEGGALDLANGVTSARDMANDTDTFPQRVARYDDGTELGPRVLKAGIIDGTGRACRSDQDAGRYRREGD